ncbi:WD40 repeat-like protein [Phlebopus sp. FC_14]|nr:WD40 repeat-like protein [Phlebopus sp. FC_14]
MAQAVSSPNPLGAAGFSGKNLRPAAEASTFYSEGPMSSSTLYMPVASPPTPAPSPGPTKSYRSDDFPHFKHYQLSYEPASLSRAEFANLSAPESRKRYLLSLLSDCTPSELLFISQTIAPMLKRDFLVELPPEIAFHILSFVDDPRTLARASQVSKPWNDLVSDEWLWKAMCGRYNFKLPAELSRGLNNLHSESNDESSEEMDKYSSHPREPSFHELTAGEHMKRQERSPSSSWTPNLGDNLPGSTRYTQSLYRKHFQRAYSIMRNMRSGGKLLRAHRMPIVTPDGGVITSVALDSDRVIVGLANSKIHIFSTNTGVLCRTLTGHEMGVWAVHLVSRGGYWEEPVDVDTLGNELRATSMPLPDSTPEPNIVPPKLRTALGLDMRRRVKRPTSTQISDGSARSSDSCCASEGWGQPNPIVVSGGCDKHLRVWDVVSGHCIYVLRGHTSTIRCIRVLHNRPIAVTGSRDATLRVWNIQEGRMLRLLRGHEQSVRCLDVCGNRVVSGSYDGTCRIWNVDTGACLHVLRGHEQQIYSVAFDGDRIASGGIDTTVRVWDANTGRCIALLQGHTALVCQLQLSSSLGLLATGGSDGRVITFDLHNYTALQRIAAHDSSVTSLQFDCNFLVTGGNDGRVRMYETQSGTYVRDLIEGCETVWKVAFKGATCAIMCKKSGMTVMEIWTFRPRENRFNS